MERSHAYRSCTTIWPKILAGNKFGDLGPKITIARFGGSVWDCHTYACKCEILADFSFVILKVPPNFPAVR